MSQDQNVQPNPFSFTFSNNDPPQPRPQFIRAVRTPTIVEPAKFKFVPAPDHHNEKDKFLNEISNGLKMLWETKDYWDFKIITGPAENRAEIKVHRNILAMRSSVFATAFKANGMKESVENEMIIDDFNESAVKEFLEFLYTNKAIREEHAMELFALASKYDVSLLRTSTETIILKNIEESNAIEIFSLGHLYNSCKLKTATFNKIKEMFPVFMINDSLMEKPEVLKELVEARRERDLKKGQVEGEYQAKVKALGF